MVPSESKSAGFTKENNGFSGQAGVDVVYHLKAKALVYLMRAMVFIAKGTSAWYDLIAKVSVLRHESNGFNEQADIDVVPSTSKRAGFT